MDELKISLQRVVMRYTKDNDSFVLVMSLTPRNRVVNTQRD
jgi:hypothetical protein